jgi:sialate O-acetylesterase
MKAALCPLALLPALLLSVTARADDPSLLHPMFQDHGVLQRERPIPVYGSAAPGTLVTVTLGAASARATAGKDGYWQANLPPQPAGGPLTLTASAGNLRQKAQDVLVGDVYLCSGQSNMELPMRRALDTATETNRATHPMIRYLGVARDTATAPKSRFAKPVSWQAVTPETVQEMSAVCYFFGRGMRQQVDVPVGLINSAWGGSSIESWMPPAQLAGLADYKQSMAILARYDRAPREAIGDFVRQWQDWWHKAGKGEPWHQAYGQGDGWRVAPQTFRPWERWDVPDMAAYNGLVWMRATVSLTAEQAEKAVALRLGPVDDLDVTWVNGVPVGSLYGPSDPRRYLLPGKALTPGDNTISIAIIDNYGDGGLYGQPGDQAIELADGTLIPLHVPFQYQPMPMDLSAMPQAPWGTVNGLSTIHNGMLAPIGPYGLRAALWYQGESNAGRPVQYQGLLAGLMAGWRQQFGADLPFLVVQLPEWGFPVDQPVESDWARLRESQRAAVAADAHAGLAVGIGVGDWYDIHPANKQVIARRLVQAARKLVLGQAVPASGPVPVTATRQGDSVSIRFSDITGTLSALSFHRPIGFQLCGDAVGSCRYVDATLQGETVTLATGGQPATRARYCWADSPICNLYDSARLPAGPFELPIK